MMALCRPPDGPLIMALAVAVFWKYRRFRRELTAFAFGALPFAAGQLIYNWYYFGEPWIFGQFLLPGQDALPPTNYWENSIFSGLAGQLVSPSRGLFVYSPVFLWLLWKPKRWWAEWSMPVRAGVIGSFLMLLFLSRYYAWYGGWCFGYRMLADTAPILALALLPVILALKRRSQVLFGATVIASVIIHAAGAYNYSPLGWYMHPDVDYNRSRLWSVSDSQLVYVFTRPKVHVEP